MDRDKGHDPNDTETGSKKHGGELVEAISIDDLITINDPSCQHETMVRDFSEEDYLAFKCKNPNCGVVKLFDKV